MLFVGRVGLVVSRSVYLCCAVLCVCVQFGVAGLIARVLKLQMKVKLWRIGSCH